MPDGVNRSERDRVRAAAIEYPAYGWGVLPGSVWNGRRYTLGHTPTLVDGLAPAMLSGRTLRIAREVWSWWSVAPYAVLARAGEDFDVLTAPAELVTVALELPGSVVRTCPVMLAPDRTSARLVVRRGSRLRWELHGVRGVTLLPVGALVALPPTVTAEGEWSWWVDPSDAHGPGLAGAVQRALRAAAHGMRTDGRC
ncbi:hypothetical protein [Amycolatopsis sulphurea]|uniref:hypothetical protein n=1 Tax=Amycolatopsis sulphurea TaxID=76022 RepID=UPI0011458557|nr:hypothetical protein [Amycolatopsis sulphurea]